MAKTEVAAEPPDVARAAVERQQVVLENLDGVEAGGGDRARSFSSSAPLSETVAIECVHSMQPSHVHGAAQE